jgi:hypothetical protein
LAKKNASAFRNTGDQIDRKGVASNDSPQRRRQNKLNKTLALSKLMGYRRTSPFYSLVSLKERKSCPIAHSLTIVVPDYQAESLLLRAWDKKLIGTRMLRPLLNEWRNPSFEEFEDRNPSSMLSAYTHIAKDRQRRYPHRAAYEVMQFQNLLAA